jgi:hypothetical protein
MIHFASHYPAPQPITLLTMQITASGPSLIHVQPAKPAALPAPATALLQNNSVDFFFERKNVSHGIFKKIVESYLLYIHKGNNSILF